MPEGSLVNTILAGGNHLDPSEPLRRGAEGGFALQPAGGTEGGEVMKPDIVTGNVYECLFCKQYVSEVIDPYSGVYDYHDDGDFGCCGNPITGPDGTGPHFPITRANIEKIALMQSPGCTITRKKGEPWTS